jgi:hypothetical protein
MLACQLNTEKFMSVQDGCWPVSPVFIRAGLAHVLKLASLLKVAMPPAEATLNANDAFDIAAFVNYNARPVFSFTD